MKMASVINSKRAQEEARDKTFPRLSTRFNTEHVAFLREAAYKLDFHVIKLTFKKNPEKRAKD